VKSVTLTGYQLQRKVEKPTFGYQSIRVTKMPYDSRKSVTKLPQKSMLRKFAKASEAEICARVCRRYLTFYAGLRFENEPGLTELDAAEGRRNRLPRRIRRFESANLPWSWARRQTAYARFCRHEGIINDIDSLC